MKKNKSVIFFVVLLVFFILWNTSFAKTIDTRDLLKKYQREALYINDNVKISFDWDFETRYYKISKSFYWWFDTIKLPRLSWIVKDIADKIWKDNFIKNVKLWVILVEWNLLKFWKYQWYNPPYWASPDYFDWKDTEEVETKWVIINVAKYTKINNEKKQKWKVIVEPFDAEIIWTAFNSSRERPVPKLTIYDEISWLINLRLSLTPDWVNTLPIRYGKPKIKYKLQKYLVDITTREDKKPKTTFSYILIPYYEFDVDFPAWGSEVWIFYRQLKRPNAYINIREFDFDEIRKK